MSETITRYAELRHTADRTVSGVVVDYADSAGLYGTFRERFLPGSIVTDDVVLNLMHDRTRPLAREGAGLVLQDSAERLELRADIIDTRDGDDALRMVQSGILRGLSMEFHAVKEEMRNATRTIKRARLTAVGLVDKPAYAQSVLKRFQPTGSRLECRANSINGEIEFDELAITSQQHGRGVIVTAGSLSLADDVFLLNSYDYSKAIASTGSDTLNVRMDDDRLVFSASRMARTEALRDTRQRIRAGLLNGAIPGIRILDSENRKIGDIDTEVINEGVLCEINIISHVGGGRVATSGRTGRRMLL